MDIRKLQRAIVDGLEDVKAQHIRVFNTEHLSPLFERVIVASGSSNRQTKALASSVRETVKARGLPVLRTEGEANGEWIIVDCGAAVVHIMQPTIREYYRLEEIWGDKAVRMKLGAATGRGPARPSEPMATEDASPPSRQRPLTRAAPPRRGAAASTAARTGAPRKAAAAKSSPRGPGGGKRPATSANPRAAKSGTGAAKPRPRKAAPAKRATAAKRRG
jgi:ribosome-associated protein